MRNQNLWRSIPLLLLASGLFLIPVIAVRVGQAATLYVATPQSVPAGNDTTGDGTAAKPYATIAKALSRTVAGDLVSIGDGTYATGQLVIPPQVSLTSTRQNSRGVKLTPSQNLYVDQPLLVLDSPAPGSSGNQSISHLEISGVNGSWVARNAIRIKNRNQVTITHCAIHDFNGAKGVYAVQVFSSFIPFNIGWKYYWPADPQAIGIDDNIESGINDGSIPVVYPNTPTTPVNVKYAWPAQPLEAFELSHCTITNCGWKGIKDSLSSAVQPFHLKNSSFHNNIIDTTTSGGQCINQCSAFLWHVDIHDNQLINQRFSDRSTYPLEFWLLRHCNIYNNVSNHGFSLAYGKQTNTYNNTVVFIPEQYGDHGLGIEYIGQSYGELYGNFIRGANVYGIDWGSPATASGKNWISEHVTIRNNVILSMDGQGIGVFASGGSVAGYTNHVRYGNIYNNVIDGGSRGDLGIHLTQTDHTGLAAMSDISIKNNVIVNVATTGWTQGSVSAIAITHNLIYRNLNPWNNGILTNTLVADPLFVNPGQNFSGYALQTSPVLSPCIDSGAMTGLPYNGAAPDRGAIESGGTALLPPLAPRGLTTR